MVFREHRLFRCAPEETPPERWSNEGEWRVVAAEPECFKLAPWEWQWEDAEYLRQVGQLVKMGPPRTVVRARVGNGEVYLKRYSAPSPGKRFFHPFRRSAGMAEFAVGRKLLRRGIATARPLLSAERSRGRMSLESIVATEALGGTSLPLFISRLDDAEEKTAFLDSLARGLAELHDMGFKHGSLDAQHVVVRDGSRFALIDLYKSAFFIPWRLGPRSYNLWTLTKRLGARITFWEYERFLRTYASASKRAPPLLALQLGILRRVRSYVRQVRRRRLRESKAQGKDPPHARR